ncbi:hypothetical protein [Burkholderia sp. Bp8998]|uniref:hypothetical protein n=1 Tax=Burkholderia sp. Bp8998 TaxID=2184557 RepID=UPI0016395DA9|nr:hypothetical protein [Burkholderia sp. Bp8998]
MTQSMIGWIVGFIAVAVVAISLARRYRSEHPGVGMIQWLDSHHMGWMHRKH